MKLLYIANIRLPTEKAHGYQIMKMCQAFKGHGIDVELMVAKRFNKKLKNFDSFDFYGIKERFKVKKIFCIDAINPVFNKLWSLGFIIQTLSFTAFLIPHILARKVDYLYCRDELVVYFLSFFRKNIIYEAHAYSRLGLKASQRLQKESSKIIVISQGIKDKLVGQGIAASQIIVVPDGVDLDDFNIDEEKNESRKKLKLPLDKKIAMYSGHLFGWKGAFTLADASQYLDDDTILVFVGGMPEDLDKFKKYINEKKYDNILVLGHKKHQEIPVYLNAADVLVLPNSGRQDISRHYTSPLKMFEYMAARRPIVASDLPSIREVLDNNLAVFVEPDDPNDLGRGIKRAIDNDNELMVNSAYKKVKQYNWSSRAKRILDYVLD